MLKLLPLIILVKISSFTFAQSPTLFLEGTVSTNLSERDMAISPDGSEMFYTIQSNQHVFSTIVQRKKTGNNTWSAPEVASFSGMFSDLEPAFSPDGTKLFFSSNRPLSGDTPKDFDIWVSEKLKGTWSVPRNLGTPINTKANEFYPSVSNNGTVYFTAEYERGVGREDIFASRFVNDAFSDPVALDTAVNSKLWEFNAFVSPDESFILFTSYGRTDDQGGGDLYISEKKDGNWQPAYNLSSINSPQLDYCPFVIKNNLYFTSGRHGIKRASAKPITYDELIKSYNGTTNGLENIYWISLKDALAGAKKVPLR